MIWPSTAVVIRGSGRWALCARFRCTAWLPEARSLSGCRERWDRDILTLAHDVCATTASQDVEWDAAAFDDPAPELLAMVRVGSHPLDAYGPAAAAYAPKLAAALSKILVQCNAAFGGLRTTSPGYVLGCVAGR